MDLGLKVGLVVSLHFQDKPTQFCDTYLISWYDTSNYQKSGTFSLVFMVNFKTNFGKLPICVPYLGRLSELAVW
jgi:hypothetical protein